MQNTLPIWARVPKHKKEVVATEKGWVVKETGELLRSVSNLPERLNQLKQDTDYSLEKMGEVDSKVSKEDFDDITKELGGEDPSDDNGDSENEDKKDELDYEKLEPEDGESLDLTDYKFEEDQDKIDYEKSESESLDITDEEKVKSDDDQVDLNSMDDGEVKEYYVEVFGKKPHHMKKTETMIEEIQEKLSK